MKNKLLLFVLLIASGVQAQLIEIDFQEKVEESSFIAEAEVVSENFFYADGSQDIYTIYELSVFKIFKGDETNITNENRMYVIVPGGRIGNDELLVEPNLYLEVGEISTILLKNNTIAATDLGYPENILYEPIQNAQSRYSYFCETGEVLGFFQTFASIPNFYEQLVILTGQSTLEIQAYEPCGLPIPVDPQAIVISGFSPASVPAGALQVLTITGSGFGNTQGSQGVIFKKNNGSNYLQKLSYPSQFISWSDTQIEVLVPYWAGTGKLGVGYASSPVYAATDIVIPYAESGIQQGSTYYQTRHVDIASGAASLVWELNTAFSTNTSAVDALKRARKKWVCETNMGWHISETTTSVNTPTADNINVVTFDPSMSSGVLGVCYSRYSNCGGERYVVELDLVFNPNVNWNFTQNSPTSNEVDFETVALHELGHGRQLGHVNDASKVMNSSLGAGISRRIISADEQTGGLDINARSSNLFLEICGQGAITSIICPPPITTGIPDINFEVELVNLGYDWGSPDGWVYTEDISSVEFLDLDGLEITDLTGIQDFAALEIFTCQGNIITSVDLSNNHELISLQLNNNPLTNLNVKNDNNTAIELFSAVDNPDLYCIEVDDAEYSTANWTNIDPQAGFSENCSLGILEVSEMNISIYPNPASTILNVIVEMDTDLMVYDIQGRLIINKTHLDAGNNKLDVSNLITGIYFVRISSEANSIIKRIIIE